MSKTVAVTGLSGLNSFTAALAFLKAGWKVRGSVRSQKNINYLNEHPLLKKYMDEGKVSMVIVEDLGTGDFHQLLDGVDALAHTAMPFAGMPINTTWEQWRDTSLARCLNIIKAAVKYDNIKSVVYYSSLPGASSFVNNREDGKAVTGDDWNNDTEEEAAKKDPRNPMDTVQWWWVCKKKAEQSAWKVHEEEAPHWRFSTLLQAVPIGPTLHIYEPKGFESLTSPMVFVSQLLQGKDGEISRDLPFARNLTDPRMLADACVGAMSGEKSGRYILPAPGFTYQEIANAMRRARPDLDDKIALGNPDKADDNPQDIIKVDDGPALNELGVKRISLEDTVKDMLAWWTETGVLPKAPSTVS